ncbi:hypothetical protein GVAV_001663 [Gurleya vavrai]
MKFDAKSVTLSIISATSLTLFVVLLAKLCVDNSKERKTSTDKSQRNNEENSLTHLLKNDINQNKLLKNKEKSSPSNNHSNKNRLPQSQVYQTEKGKVLIEDIFDEDSNDESKVFRSIPFNRNHKVDINNKLDNASIKIFNPAGKNHENNLFNQIVKGTKINENSKIDRIDLHKLMSVSKTIFLDYKDKNIIKNKEANLKAIKNHLHSLKYSKDLQDYICEKYSTLNLHVQENLKFYYNNPGFISFQGILSFIVMQFKSLNFFEKGKKYNNEFIEKFSKLDTNDYTLVSTKDCMEIYMFIIAENNYEVYKNSVIVDMYNLFMNYLTKKLGEEYKLNNNVNGIKMIKFIDHFNGIYEISQINQNFFLKNSDSDQKEDPILFLLRKETYTLQPNYIEVFYNMIDSHKIPCEFLNQGFNANVTCTLSFTQDYLKIIKFPNLLILPIKDYSDIKKINFIHEYRTIELPNYIKRDVNLENYKQTYILKFMICKLIIENQIIIFNFLFEGNKCFELSNELNHKKIVTIEMIDKIFNKTTGDMVLFYSKETKDDN